MRFREVVRFELAYRLRRPSTWIFAGILLLLTFWITLANADSNDPTQANAPVRLAVLAVILGMIGIVVTAALFGDAAVRDAEAGMDPLLFTTPLEKAEYLGGRFLSALAVNAVLLVAIPLGQMAATLVPFLPTGTFGPFRAIAYLQPFLFFLLPNLVLVGAILFTIAALARKTVPVYLGAIGLFIAYLLAASLWDQVGNPVLSMLGDPLGAGALENMTRYWTVAEQNTRLVGLPAMLVWNRVLWLALAGAVLGLLHNRFRFAHGEEGGRRRKGRGTITDPGAERARPVAAVPRVAGSFGLRTWARQTLAVARHSLGEFAASRWFAGVLIVCTGLTVLMGWNVGETVFDTSTWPVTLLVAGTVLSQRIVPILYLLIILYAGELVWKDRAVEVAEITDAAPVPEGALLLGRFLALVAMVAMLQAALMAGGILIQTLQGYHHLQIGLYLRILFGLDLADYVLLAALAMTIHVVVNHKYLGHMIVLIAFLSTVALPGFGLVQHHLLLYGTDPGWTYSDMNGFGPFIGPFVWFKLYWAAWALLLVGVVANLLQVRGREAGLRHRLRASRERFMGPVVGVAGTAALLILGVGSFIFYNTNILNDYRGPDEAGAPQAEYEKRYRHFEDAAQPVIAGVELLEEIYPDEPAVDLSGTYHMVNRTDEAIDSVHVLTTPGSRADSLSFDVGSEPVLVDDEVGYRIFALARPLEPGDSLRLSFDVSYRPRGFPNGGIQTQVVGNGALFDRRLLPFIGYQPLFELSDDRVRQHFGLGPRPPMPSPGDPGAGQTRRDVRDSDRVRVDAVVGTSADQIAVTPGVLQGSWTENGRRYFHYRTEEPVSFGNGVLSAKYAVLEDRWHDVALQIFHHPAHDYDLDRMVRGMKAALDYYTENFGPYEGRQLRIVEFPRYGGTGHAGPHTIAFAEDVFLSRVREGEIDQPFFGTAHEVAHQWWGGQVSGAPVRGHGFLSESLANYSAMMVVEKTYGHAMARRVYDFQMGHYLLGRASRSREVPLLEVEDQPYVYYRKGAVAMYTLRERIGEEAVNTALRRYLEKYRDAGPPYPSSLDLYAELQAVTPDSLRYVLTDLFETVTLWDLKAKRAVVEPTGTGEYRVTLDVAARKVRADSVGNETEVPMDEPVEIGVFARGEGGAAGEVDGGEPLYLERRRIRSGEQTITVIVPREPARAGIDPRHEMIDRNVVDNVIGVEREKAGGASRGDSSGASRGEPIGVEGGRRQPAGGE